MFCLTRFLSLCVCGLAAVSAGARTDDAAPRTLDLQPPEEDLGSIGSALSAIIAAEEGQWQQARVEYDDMRQRILDVGKERVRETIRKAFVQSVPGRHW